jgi:hypothetical protein
MTTIPKKPEVELTNLKLNEFSTVDQGDNPEAHIVMTKRDEDADKAGHHDGKEPTKKPGHTMKPEEEDKADMGVDGKKPKKGEDKGMGRKKSLWERFSDAVGLTRKGPRSVKEILGNAAFEAGFEEAHKRSTSEILQADEMRQGFFKVQMALMQSINEIMMEAEPQEMAPMLSKTVSEFGSEIDNLMSEIGKRDEKSALKLTSILDRMSAAVSNEGEMPADKLAAFEDALADLEKDFEFPTETSPEVEMTEKIDNFLKSVTADELEVLRTKLAPADETNKAADEVKTEDDVLKSLPPEVAKMITDAQADAAKAKDKADSLEKAAQEAEDIEKARELGVAGADVKDVAKMIGNAREAGTLEETMKVVRALAAQAQKGREYLESNLGSNVVETETSKSIETRARELMAETNKSLGRGERPLTYEQAYVKVLHSERGLYDQMRAEQASA